VGCRVPLILSLSKDDEGSWFDKLTMSGSGLTMSGSGLTMSGVYAPFPAL
jgi:hypothetical protein